MEENPSQKRKGSEIALLVCLLLIAAFLFTSFQLNISRELGKLSTVSNYDDVTYLNKASTVFFLGKKKGVGAAAKWLFTQNLHAPFSVFNGVLGFNVFGYSTDRVYYALTLVVFTFMAFVAGIARKLPPFLFGAIILSSLSLPFVTMCALEFRPDLMWATVLTGGSLLFLCYDRPFDGWKCSAMFGLALGVALMCKPSTFAMTLLVMGGCWLLAAMIALLTKAASGKQIAQGLLWTAGIAFAFSGWYWLQHIGEIFNYFVINSFGDQKDVWVFRGTMQERLTYYLKGAPLQSNLGAFFVPFLIIYVVGALNDLIRGNNLAERLRGASLLWMLIALLSVNSFFSMKSPFLGGSFYGFLIFGSIWHLSRALTGWSKGWLKSLPLQATVACVMTLLAWTYHKYPVASMCYPPAVANQAFTNKGILQDMLARTPGKASSILFTQGNPIVPEYLAMEFRSRGKRLEFCNAAMERTVESAVAMDRTVQFVVLQDQNIIGAPGDAIPGEKLQPALMNYYRNTPEWQLAADYPMPDGKKVYLFERIKTQP